MTTTETENAAKNERNQECQHRQQATAGKVRRAFSMPRNPFRWSRKFKTSSDASVHNKDDTSKRLEDGSLITVGDRVNEHPNGKSIYSENTIHYKGSTEARKHTTMTTTSKTTNNIDGNLKNHQKQQNYHHGSQKPQKLSENISSTANRVFRRTSFRKFLTRIAHVTSVSFGVKHSGHGPADRVPPINTYQWPPDQTPGVTGLKNHGNTCFMNAVLQCLSHTDILAEYFVLDQYKADLKRRNKLNSRKFGTKGELTEQLANVLKALWTCKNETDHSTSFKAVVDRYGTQFRSSTQHDAQEFLFWLLDKVHEDLNTATKRRYKSIKNTYGRPDEVIAAETLANHIRCNNSFVQAVFQAQFRSSLTCNRCHKQSNTFDPFHCISVQLPQVGQQIIFVTVLYVTQHPKQVKLGLTVATGAPIIALREQLHADTGILVNRMVLVDINETGFCRVFCDSQPISTLDGINTLYCVEIPDVKKDTSAELLLLVANVKKMNEKVDGDVNVDRFGTPFCMKVNRDCNYVELQKKILKEMSSVLKTEVFAYATPTKEMFRIRLQDPSADPITYLEDVEHPLLTEMIDMALSVLSSDAGPSHVKLLLEWCEPEKFFADLSDPIVDHESVSQLKANSSNQQILTLEQCLEHYTKAEKLSAEDAWRCPNCQQYLPVVKTLGLWSLPDILVIHFKRFRQHHDKGADAAKLTTMVSFPLNAFDMSPHLARGSRASNDSLNNEHNDTSTVRHNYGSPWRKIRDSNRYHHKDQELKDTRYDLYAVCYHQGDTLETGHYTAACKNPYDHQWYKFDDQRVNQVPADKISQEIVNNEAYILFYQRRKADTTECSGTSSNSGDHWVSRIAVPSSQAESCAGSTTLIEKANEKQTLEPEEAEGEKLLANSEARKQQPPQQPTETLTHNTLLIEKTDETEIIDVENLEFADEDPKDHVIEDNVLPVCVSLVNNVPESPASIAKKVIVKAEVTLRIPENILQTNDCKDDDVELAEKDLVDTSLSISSSISSSSASSDAVPIAKEELQHMWPTAAKFRTSLNEQFQPRSSFNFSDAFSKSIRTSSESIKSSSIGLRHSFSTSSGYKIKDCDALSMLRNSGSSCSKDTLIFIDQQSHSLMEEDDDDSFLGSGGRSHWISPVTPHKLITVSPKN